MTHVVIAVAVLYVAAAVIILHIIRRPWPSDEEGEDWPEGVTADDVRSLYGEWQIRHADRLREEIR